MKLMASTMLSDAIRRQYSSVCPLLCPCLSVLTKFVERQWISYFFIRITLIKIVNKQLNWSALLVLSVINWRYCSYTGIFQIRLEISPETDLARFPKNDQIPDSPELELKSGATLSMTRVRSTLWRITTPHIINKNCYYYLRQEVLYRLFVFDG